ncbi:hypothetical protein PSTT_12036 [Puccinia striiformis]|uniref:Uncharacterized protein n=1 Tax=Puccinia striiformis TaxID=27350 RepID=A0A2S4UXX0_9BASI|nr:hypothetical protein PSTT_12036 [Puccinia striiformis]
MTGGMAVWEVDSNAISLVDLVIGVGIAVEFCSHYRFFCWDLFDQNLWNRRFRFNVIQIIRDQGSELDDDQDLGNLVQARYEVEQQQRNNFLNHDDEDD